MRAIKYILVAGELIIGAFILATVSGAIVENIISDPTTSVEPIEAFVKTLIALLFIGGALFYDGIRRGRRWW